MEYATMMTLEPHGPDTFVGVGPRYPWGGVYGGQIVAQALRAAAMTVDPAYRVHSLHAFFIRRGDADEPIRFEVDRLRDGRSFVTRAVVARQAGGAILNLSASFQVDEAATDVEAAAGPEVSDAGSAPPTSWSPMFDRRFVAIPGPGRATATPGPGRATATPGPGRATAWLRMNHPIGDDPVLHACALAYLSDDLPTDAVARLHPDGGGEWVEGDWMSASLDHAIWFHRPAPSDDWQLQDFRCHGLLSSRGLAIGQVFGVDGTHLATVAQEVLLRRRPPADAR